MLESNDRAEHRGAIMRRTCGAANKFGGQVSRYQSCIWSRVVTAFAALAAVASTTTMALADEDGISFWIPGFFGSLAAAPQQPGWSLTSIYYHDDVSGSGNEAIARAIRLGLIPKVTVSISGNADVHAKNVNIGFIAPTYVFATPFLGGQVSASLLMGYGNNDTTLNATATASTDMPPFRHLPVDCPPARHMCANCRSNCAAP